MLPPLRETLAACLAVQLQTSNPKSQAAAAAAPDPLTITTNTTASLLPTTTTFAIRCETGYAPTYPSSTAINSRRYPQQPHSNNTLTMRTSLLIVALATLLSASAVVASIDEVPEVLEQREV